MWALIFQEESDGDRVVVKIRRWSDPEKDEVVDTSELEEGDEPSDE